MTEQYDWSEVPPSVAVVQTVSDLDDTEIEALPPLAHRVDVDALDNLLRETATTDPEGVIVSIQYHGYDVSISSAGWIEAEQ